MKLRKRILSTILTTVLAVSLVGCGEGGTTGQTSQKPQNSASSDSGTSQQGSNNSASSGQDSQTAQSSQNSQGGEENSSDKVLKLQWHQSIGIETIFEDPWRDQQSLIPNMIFDSLVKYEEQNEKYVPCLAEKWEISDDYTEFKLTIRNGVKWSDGEPFSIDDVLFTFVTQLQNPVATYAKRFNLIEGAQDVLDGKTKEVSGIKAEGNVFTIKLIQSDTLFLRNLSAYYILPKHLLKDVAPADLSTYEKYWTKPIGTGQYKLDEVKFPDYCTLVPNEATWNSQPGIKNVQFVNYATGGNNGVVAALIGGDLDFARGNDINDIKVANNIVSQNKDVVVKELTSTYTRFFAFNLEGRKDGNNIPDLKKPEVRQAIDMIIDKNTIASFYDGQAVGLSTFCNPASPEYNNDIPLPKKDIEKAKQMLKDAGFDFSKTLQIAYYYNDQTTIDIMSLIQQDFAEAGITVETNLLTGDLATLIYKDANYDMLYLASGGTRPCDLYNYMRKETQYTFIGENEKRSGLYEQLFLDYTGTMDPAKQKEYANKLQAVDYQNRYSIPVYALNTLILYNKGHVSIPEDIMKYDGCTNYRYEEWKMVN